MANFMLPFTRFRLCHTFHSVGMLTLKGLAFRGGLMLFRTVSCFLAVSLLSGCSMLDMFSASQGGEGQGRPQQAEVSGVSPQARRYMEAAGRLCPDPIGCSDAERAAELLDMAVKADPLDPSAYMARGRMLSELGEYEEAFNDATKAIRLRPSAEAYATRGLVCARQSAPEGALRDFAYAEKLDSQEPLLYAYRAAGMFSAGDSEKGCADLKKACKLGFCLSLDKAKEGGLCR